MAPWFPGAGFPTPRGDALARSTCARRRLGGQLQARLRQPGSRAPRAAVLEPREPTQGTPLARDPGGMRLTEAQGSWLSCAATAVGFAAVAGCADVPLADGSPQTEV